MSSHTHPQFSGKKVAVLGFGVEGKSATRFLLKHKVEVTVFDEADEKSFDTHDLKEFTDEGVMFSFGNIGDLTRFDMIVRSPGVLVSIKPIQHAIENGVELTSVTKLFFQLAPCPIIGVTGTKGKGTTSTLIHEMLKAQKKDAYLGGNIGVPALDFLDRLTPESVAVLELSSFQLVDFNLSSGNAGGLGGKPHIAVMLMVTSEHLDYHKDIDEYVQAKRNILVHQTDTDFAILNRDYLASRESDIHTAARVFHVSREDEPEEGAFIRDGAVMVRLNGTEGKVIEVDEIKLVGAHNLENVTAAVMAALLGGVSKKNIQSVLKTFKGLEHRLEFVREIGGVKYYDDSFSTTPETAAAAIDAFEDPQILILGGSGKNSDFSRLGKLISEKENIKAIIGIGEEWNRIKSEIENSRPHRLAKHGGQAKFETIENCKNMKEIVEKAAEIAEPGDVVLLSPACASFDMFKDYKDRGNQFKKEVSKLK